MIVLALFLCGFACLFFQLMGYLKKKKKLPPGPTIWPLVGNIFELIAANPKHPHFAMAKLAKKYGNVMGFGFGVHYAVLLSGYEEMKDILKRPETCDSRFQFSYVEDRNFNKNLGLIWGCGDVWREARRFTIRTLRDFGFGKTRSMEVVINEEITEFLATIRKSMKENNGVWAVDSHFLSGSALNVLWSLVAGYRFSHNDPEFNQNLRLNRMAMKAVGHDNKYTMFPFLKVWCPKLVDHDVHKETFAEMQSFMKSLIDDVKIKRTRQGKTESQNFVEVFLDEIEKNKKVNSIFTEEHLIIVLLDLFFAGADTTSMTLNWIFLFLTINPECQSKLQKELSISVPLPSDLSLADVKKIPYLQAVILEGLRLGNAVPIPAPRMMTGDIVYKNFLIPKGAILFANAYPVMMDESYWGDAHVFRPERFLNESGEIISEKVERIIVFGLGKRQCLGESSAWDSLFMFVAAVFRQFIFEPIKGEEPSAEDPLPNTTIQPRPYRVQVLENNIL